MSTDPKGHLPFFKVKEKQAWRGRRGMLIGDQILGAGSCRGQPLSAASIHASLDVCVPVWKARNSPMAPSSSPASHCLAKKLRVELEQSVCGRGRETAICLLRPSRTGCVVHVYTSVLLTVSCVRSIVLPFSAPQRWGENKWGWGILAGDSPLLMP